MLSAHARQGFTLIELMVTLAVLATLTTLATPSFMRWLANAQTRAMADELQNGLKLAQAEALRLQRQTLFFRSAVVACDDRAQPDSAGTHWVIRTIPLLADEAARIVQCGALNGASTNVLVDGPVALCFNSIGRPVANPAPGVDGLQCVVPNNGRLQFDASNAKGDRALRVTVSVGGGIRMCDPSRERSVAPEGCE
ncbi:Tfp pilus assembly protein FimT/FimU [Roseateles sp. BYS180W]|uniref:Type II secretion system protein H n=1 Tax=Roseateles rivi TaxID=3299028 RepID=A0ABW7FRD6_9BURK